MEVQRSIEVLHHNNEYSIALYDFRSLGTRCERICPPEIPNQEKHTRKKKLFEYPCTTPPLSPGFFLPSRQESHELLAPFIFEPKYTLAKFKFNPSLN